MNGQYEFKTNAVQLIALFKLSQELVEMLPNGSPFEDAAIAMLHTMCACTIDKSTGEYVNVRELGLMILSEGPDTLLDWIDAFKEYCNELFENEGDDPRLKPFKDYLGGLDEC